MTVNNESQNTKGISATSNEMSDNKRILLIFIASVIFAGIMYFINEDPFGKKEEIHRHGAGVVEEHED